MALSDEVADRMDDAIEHVLSRHYTLPDYECSCGAKNNMDGDMLHGHRLSRLSEAILPLVERYGEDRYDQGRDDGWMRAWDYWDEG